MNVYLIKFTQPGTGNVVIFWVLALTWKEAMRYATDFCPYPLETVELNSAWDVRAISQFRAEPGILVVHQNDVEKGQTVKVML